MAECAWLWCECRKRYGAKVDNPAWFMTLYQMMVASRFTDLSNKNTKINTIEEKAWLFNITVQPEVDLALKLQSVSNELREVLNIFFNTPKEVLETIVSADASAPHIFRSIADMRGISKSNVLMDELKFVLGTQRTRIQPRRRAVTATD